MSAIELVGAPRHYDWGSRTAIPRLLNERDDGRPVAELWFGSHPDNPSLTPHGPFTEPLPFLVKILAASMPLSIQVHPTIDQAQLGYFAEEAAHIPRDAPTRVYRDRNHKPELLVALTPFQALCGFRPADQTVELLDSLGMGPLRDIVAEDGLQAAMTAILDLDQDTVHAHVRMFADSPQPALRGAQLAAACFPGDPGVLVALLLNYVLLNPGEGLYLGAGTVHAYLRGMGVEVMASSDNVLRAGLTSKHIDREGLLAITDFTAGEPQVLAPGDFIAPVPDFRLRRQVKWVEGPAIVLCTEGQVLLDSLTLTPGHAAFVPATDRPTTLHVHGEIFVADANPHPTEEHS